MNTYYGIRGAMGTLKQARSLFKPYYVKSKEAIRRIDKSLEWLNATIENKNRQ